MIKQQLAAVLHLMSSGWREDEATQRQAKAQAESGKVQPLSSKLLVTADANTTAAAAVTNLSTSSSLHWQHQS